MFYSERWKTFLCPPVEKTKTNLLFHVYNSFYVSLKNTVRLNFCLRHLERRFWFWTGKGTAVWTCACPCACVPNLISDYNTTVVIMYICTSTTVHRTNDGWNSIIVSLKSYDTYVFRSEYVCMCVSVYVYDDILLLIVRLRTD